MNKDKPRLDDPVFSGRLKQRRNLATYARRPVQRPQVRINDISAVKKPDPKRLGLNVERVRTAVAAKPAARLHPRPKSEVLWRSAVLPKKPLPVANPAADQPKHSPRLLYAMAAVIFLIGLGVSLGGLRTNQKAQAQVNKIAASQSQDSSDNKPPSTRKPSDEAVRRYSTPADLPRYIDIPSLKVHARTYAVGTDKKGALIVPANIYDTDWYKQSSKPGAAGAMLIDGHSGLNNNGVFSGLNRLKAGDVINITRGDGSVFHYTVVKSQLYDSAHVDMASLLVSADTSKPGLNLISCSGDIIPGTYDLNKRLAVYAVEQ